MKNNQLEKLSDYADYSKAKISIAEIDTKCYFSTENMLPNKGGVTEAAGLPTQDNVTKVLPENVLVSNIRPYFKKIYFANELAGASNDVLCFVAKNGCLPRYLYYLLSSDSFFDYMMAGAKGTKMPRGDKGQIMNFPVWVPAQNEQSRIVSVLSALDEKIENISKINHNLEEQAKAIFDDMFPGITDGDSCVGDIITPKTFHNVSNTTPPVLTISASGANAGYVSLWTIPVWSSDSSFIDSSMTGNVYFWYVLLKKRQKEIFDAQTGSAQPHIYPQHIAQMSLANISKQDIEAFTNTVKPIFDTIGENKKQNKRLAQLRDALLPKLMAGEIDVSEVEV